MTTAQVIAEAIVAARKCQTDINAASTIVANSSLSAAHKKTVETSLAKASGDLNTSIKDLTSWVPDSTSPVSLTLTSSEPYKIIDPATNAVVASGSGTLEVEY